MKNISFILPVYNASKFIEAFHETLTKETAVFEKKYKINYLYIDDGSKDDSSKKLKQIQKKDNRVRLIIFSRNFGHQAAITAGLDFCIQDDAVIIMDTDLQDPPKVCKELVKKWEEGFDVVYAIRKTRKDPLLKKIASSIFYRVLNYLSDINIPKDTGEFRIIDKKVIKAISEFNERNRFMRGLMCYVGFNQTGIYFDRDERFSGKGEYTLKKMLKLAFDGMTGFSTKPLKFISLIGFIFSSLSLLGILYVMVVKLFFPLESVPGWAFIAITTFFFGGFQLVMLGIIGLYIGRIYGEAQQRPIYIVSEDISSKEN